MNLRKSCNKSYSFIVVYTYCQFYENCESEDLIDSHDGHPAVTAKPIQCTGPVYIPLYTLLPQPQHIGHPMHPGRLIHPPFGSSQSPPGKRLPAVGLVPYLNTLTISEEHNCMVPHHITVPTQREYQYHLLKFKGVPSNHRMERLPGSICS